MWRNFVARMLNKYQWFINPFINKRDPLALLMIHYGFSIAPFRMKKHIHPFYDNGRLIGIFIVNVPGDMFNTQLQVCIYKKHELNFGKPSKELYCLVHMFMHGGSDIGYKLGSHFKTDFVEFKDIPNFLKLSKNLVETRAMVFRIQQTSKKKPVTQHETT